MAVNVNVGDIVMTSILNAFTLTPEPVTSGIILKIRPAVHDPTVTIYKLLLWNGKIVELAESQLTDNTQRRINENASI